MEIKDIDKFDLERYGTFSEEDIKSYEEEYDKVIATQNINRITNLVGKIGNEINFITDRINDSNSFLTDLSKIEAKRIVAKESNDIVDALTYAIRILSDVSHSITMQDEH